MQKLKIELKKNKKNVRLWSLRTKCGTKKSNKFQIEMNDENVITKKIVFVQVQNFV